MRNSYPSLPLWLHEGIGELYSSFSTSGGKARIGIPVVEHMHWLGDQPLMPLADLLNLGAESRDYNEGSRRGVFYAQSWALTHYLLVGSEARRQQAPRFFQALKRGESATEAFRSSFGEMAVLEKELQIYVRRRIFQYREIPVGPVAGESAAAASRLPRPELFARLGLLLAYVDPSLAPAADEHFRAALAEQPENGAALTGLGVLAEQAGRPEEAHPYLRRAAAAAPDDFLIQYLHGDRELEQAPDPEAVRRAREALSRAVAIRPAFGDAWARLAFATGLAGTLRPEDLAPFETAHRLLPARMDVAFNLMLAYARSGQKRKAEEIIDTVIAAHGTPAEAERARVAWANEVHAEAERLLQAEKLEEALPILEEAAKAGNAEQRARLGDRIAEIKRIIAYNRFAERYNEALDLSRKMRDKEAIAILKDLVVEAPTPGQAEQARWLLNQLESVKR
ncbi:MAG TPA: tetratricopeptide repeat protein [Thermoanaerobaculia bacterium]|nr:tetratricopeptide repeat protein [Thermoanaerobaculia bacterium]